jgi:hypothetical protein
MKQVSGLALFLVIAALPSLSAGFRASAVEVDITPDSPQWLMGYAARQSTGVHDKIYHRIVAMDDGRRSSILSRVIFACSLPAFTGTLRKL